MYLRKKERRSCTKVYSAGARGLPRAKSQDPCPTDPTTPKARFLFAIGILKDGPCCWLRASRSFPTKLQDEPRLGLRLAPRRSWYFGTRRFATCPVPLPRPTLGGFLFRAPRCLPRTSRALGRIPPRHRGAESGCSVARNWHGCLCRSSRRCAGAPPLWQPARPTVPQRFG